MEVKSTMRLITHNMLTSNIKGVKEGFPLGIQAEKVSSDDHPDLTPCAWHAARDPAGAGERMAQLQIVPTEEGLTYCTPPIVDRWRSWRASSQRR